MRIPVTQTARLILREKVDFARQQLDRNRQNRAATVDSCFVLIGTHQHGVAVLYETSNRASSNKMQQNPCPMKSRTLNLPAPRITRCHISRASGRKQAKHRIPVPQSQLNVAGFQPRFQSKARSLSTQL